MWECLYICVEFCHADEERHFFCLDRIFRYFRMADESNKNMNHIDIKEVTISDLLQLQYISKRTFFEAFSDVNTEENMAKYLEEGFSLERLTEELNNADSEFYFALIDDNIVGYLKLNSGQSQTDLKDDHSLEIERIYVLPEFHGKKIGQLFYEKAVQIAMQKNVDYIWLGVWEENHKALKFYSKNGFVEFDKHFLCWVMTNKRIS